MKHDASSGQVRFLQTGLRKIRNVAEQYSPSVTVKLRLIDWPLGLHLDDQFLIETFYASSD